MTTSHKTHAHRGPLRPLPDLRDDTGLVEVEHLMVQLAAGSHLERAGAMAQTHLATGGKRLRARLVLAALEALGGSRLEGVGWAAAVELLHNATLVHDDIQDGDRVRRGEPTTWVRYGVGQAINVGDLMLMLPTLAIEQASDDDGVRWRLARVLAWQATEIVRGQSEEMGLLQSGRFDAASYRQAVIGKTAGLFTLPVEGAALVAGHDADAAREIGACFGGLGLLFQMVDDVLDLYCDKGRGEVGCDIREGKVSALVVAHLNRVPGDRRWLLELLELPREETSDEQVQETIAIFRGSGALGDVMAEIQQLIHAAETSPVLRAEPALHAVALGLARLAVAPVEHLA